MVDMEDKKSFVRELRASLNIINQNADNIVENLPDDDIPTFRNNIENLTNYLQSVDDNTENVSEVMTEVMSQLKKLTTVLPTKYYMPNAKVVNDIIKYNDNTDVTLRVNKNSSIKEVFAYYSLTYSDENMSISKNLTSYDREVNNSITSLFLAGNAVITPTQIVRCMLGMTASENVSPNQIADTITSVNRLRTTIVTIDATEQIKHLKAKLDGKEITKYVYNDNILNMRGEMIQAGGKEVFGYIVKEVPILYEYSRNIGQVIAVDPKLLDTRSATKNTTSIISIKGYLIRRISTMKNVKTLNQSNHILYSTIFENAGIEVNDKSQLKRYRDSIKKILTEWIKDDFIVSFSDYKSGKSIVGIEIEC